jgi:hypothetical protein
MANVFGAPLGLNAVYSIASAFISTCPSTNTALPIKAYPSLTLVSGQPTAPGALIDLMPGTMPSGPFYATFVSGLDIIPVDTQGIKNGMIMATVPTGPSGQSYVFLTTDKSGNLTDSTIIAGIIHFFALVKILLTFHRPSYRRSYSKLAYIQHIYYQSIDTSLSLVLRGNFGRIIIISE